MSFDFAGEKIGEALRGLRELFEKRVESNWRPL
jgi:hypothetical protein